MEVEEEERHWAKRKAERETSGQCAYCGKDGQLKETIDETINDKQGNPVLIDMHWFCTAEHQQEYYKLGARRLVESEWDYKRRLFYLRQLLKTDVTKRYALILEVFRDIELIRDLSEYIMKKMIDLATHGLMKESPIVCGKEHTVIMSKPDFIHVVGDNSHGQLGIGKMDGAPVNTFKTIHMPGVIAVACGDYHTLVLTREGGPNMPTTLYACGRNDLFQLGIDNGGQSVAHLTRVVDMNDVVKINCGLSQSVALKSDGSMWVAGNNGYNESASFTRTIEPYFGIIDIHGMHMQLLLLMENGDILESPWDTYISRYMHPFSSSWAPVSKNIVKICSSNGIYMFIGADGTLYTKQCGASSVNLCLLEDEMDGKKIAESVSCYVQGPHEGYAGQYACIRSDGSLWSFEGKRNDWAECAGPLQEEQYFGKNAEHVTCNRGHTFVMTKDGGLFVKGESAYLTNGQLGLTDSNGLSVSFAPSWTPVQYLVPLEYTGSKRPRCKDCTQEAVLQSSLPLNGTTLYYCHQHQ